MSEPPRAPDRRHVAITGASGLIGTAVAAELRARGDRVTRLVRRSPRAADEAAWSPERGLEPAATLDRLDAVVHLAGEAIASGRWSEARKQRIRDSRVAATAALARSLARLERPPAVFVAASAIGIYGDRGDEILTEQSPPGTGFLVGIAREWEAAAAPAREAGIRVVATRFGLVLSPHGGVLERLLLPFRLGVGGTVGRPDAWWSWVALDDVAGLVRHAIETPGLEGPCNVVAPGAVRGREFARALGRALHRPALLPVPPFVLRIALGQMADEMLLASLRVEPRRALETGYAFRWTGLGPALAHLLARAPARGRAGTTLAAIPDRAEPTDAQP